MGKSSSSKESESKHSKKSKHHHHHKAEPKKAEPEVVEECPSTAPMEELDEVPASQEESVAPFERSGFTPLPVRKPIAPAPVSDNESVEESPPRYRLNMKDSSLKKIEKPRRRNGLDREFCTLLMREVPKEIGQYAADAGYPLELVLPTCKASLGKDERITFSGSVSLLSPGEADMKPYERELLRRMKEWKIPLNSEFAKSRHSVLMLKDAESDLEYTLYSMKSCPTPNQYERFNTDQKTGEPKEEVWAELELSAENSSARIPITIKDYCQKLGISVPPYQLKDPAKKAGKTGKRAIAQLVACKEATQEKCE